MVTRYIFVFSDNDGKGFLLNTDDDSIAKTDNIDLTLEVVARDGTDEVIEFVLDETSDIFVVGREYGYGLEVNFEDADGDSFERW